MRSLCLGAISTLVIALSRPPWVFRCPLGNESEVEEDEEDTADVAMGEGELEGEGEDEEFEDGMEDTRTRMRRTTPQSGWQRAMLCRRRRPLAWSDFHNRDFPFPQFSKCDFPSGGEHFPQNVRRLRRTASFP